MKTLNHGEQLSFQALKARFLQCFGVRAADITFKRISKPATRLSSKKHDTL